MMSGMNQSVGQFEKELQDKVKELVAVIDEGNLSYAMVIIQQLHDFRHQVFFAEVGRLTRALHEAIKDFSHDMGNRLQIKDIDSANEQVDATNRLNYVIEITEKNAHETMDRVDNALSLADKLGAQTQCIENLLALVEKIEGNDAIKEACTQANIAKDKSDDIAKSLRKELTEILVSQSYQDITGQLIRRVITLLTNVEGHLIGLMEMAAKVDRLSGVGQESVISQVQENKSDKKEVEAEGPQIKKNSPDVVNSQDEVDDLLSSLGF